MLGSDNFDSIDTSTQTVLGRVSDNFGSINASTQTVIPPVVGQDSEDSRGNDTMKQTVFVNHNEGLYEQNNIDTCTCVEQNLNETPIFEHDS